MYQKFKQTMSYLTIIILLPYVITVFLTGPSTATSAQIDNNFVQVQLEEGATVEMSLEEYGIGILACEIPAEYELEALKAQAILVRTTLYKHIHENGRDNIMQEDFWTRKQMEEAWGLTRFTKNYNKMKKAWEATKEQVLTYENELAKTSYFRLSNGSTRDGEEILGEGYPYLKIVDCPLDLESVEQMQTTTIDEIDAEVTKVDTAGYVLNVKVGKENVSGEEFRKNYHLASSCFTLQNYEGKLRITTRGVGHGIGMSQYTANEMAKQGEGYEEILEYFFDGTILNKVADMVTDTSIK